MTDKGRLEKLIALACDAALVDRKLIFSKRRLQRAVDARRIIVWGLREYTEMPLKQIGHVINRDHSTVINLLTIIPSQGVRDRIAEIFGEKPATKVFLKGGSVKRAWVFRRRSTLRKAHGVFYCRYSTVKELEVSDGRK